MPLRQLTDMEKIYFVYIVSNWSHTVLYTGLTDDVERRTFEHRHQVRDGFTKKYNCYKLLYYEVFNDLEEAIHREKQIKRYRRKWKENLISDFNPEWKNLYWDFVVVERSRK